MPTPLQTQYEILLWTPEDFRIILGETNTHTDGTEKMDLC